MGSPLRADIKSFLLPSRLLLFLPALIFVLLIALPQLPVLWDVVKLTFV